MKDKLKNYIIVFLLLLVSAPLVFAGVQSNKPDIVSNIPIQANKPIAPNDTITISNSSTTTVAVPKYNLNYFDAIMGQADCLAMRDTDGNGITYITADDGVLTASAIGCQ